MFDKIASGWIWTRFLLCPKWPLIQLCQIRFIHTRCCGQRIQQWTVLDCVNTEIRIVLSLQGNPNVHCVNQPTEASSVGYEQNVFQYWSQGSTWAERFLWFFCKMNLNGGKLIAIERARKHTPFLLLCKQTKNLLCRQSMDGGGQ